MLFYNCASTIKPDCPCCSQAWANP